MTAAGAVFEVSHVSGLRALNRVLAAMHSDLLRPGGVEGATVRLPVLNIVAACTDDASADTAARAVGRIGARHYARAIIVVAAPDAATHIEADVSLQRSVVDGRTVYAEQVRLSVGGEAAFHLASVVTPLLVHDVPVYLWLIGSPPLEQAFGQDAVAVCEQIIVDSGAYRDAGAALGILARELGAVGDAVSLADIAWERGRLWRQLIAQCFDGQQVRAVLRGITAVRVECSTSVSAQGWLMAGWLDSRLRAVNDEGGWPGTTVVAVASNHGTGKLVRVLLRGRAGDHEAIVTVERRGSALHSVIDVDGGVGAEGAVPLADVDDVDLVGQQLETPAEDPVYRLALQAAARLAGASP